MKKIKMPMGALKRNVARPRAASKKGMYPHPTYKEWLEARELNRKWAKAIDIRLR